MERFALQIPSFLFDKDGMSENRATETALDR